MASPTLTTATVLKELPLLTKAEMKELRDKSNQMVKGIGKVRTGMAALAGGMMEVADAFEAMRGCRALEQKRWHREAHHGIPTARDAFTSIAKMLRDVADRAHREFQEPFQCMVETHTAGILRLAKKRAPPPALTTAITNALNSSPPTSPDPTQVLCDTVTSHLSPHASELEKLRAAHQSMIAEDEEMRVGEMRALVMGLVNMLRELGEGMANVEKEKTPESRLRNIPGPPQNFPMRSENVEDRTGFPVHELLFAPEFSGEHAYDGHDYNSAPTLHQYITRDYQAGHYNTSVPTLKNNTFGREVPLQGHYNTPTHYNTSTTPNHYLTDHAIPLPVHRAPYTVAPPDPTRTQNSRQNLISNPTFSPVKLTRSTSNPSLPNPNPTLLPLNPDDDHRRGFDYAWRDGRREERVLGLERVRGMKEKTVEPEVTWESKDENERGFGGLKLINGEKENTLAEAAENNSPVPSSPLPASLQPSSTSSPASNKAVISIQTPSTPPPKPPPHPPYHRLTPISTSNYTPLRHPSIRLPKLTTPSYHRLTPIPASNNTPIRYPSLRLPKTILLQKPCPNSTLFGTNALRSAVPLLSAAATVAKLVRVVGVTEAGPFGGIW
ncbi:hypothetical protein BC829DRAFT_440168 [Chytridium lagenaria]|nr:hypothetical protein BC829DRAFT_440168 [Chytridium lagenaria]